MSGLTFLLSGLFLGWTIRTVWAWGREVDHGAFLDSAWGVISNVSKGDWTKQSDAWVAAAQLWADHYFKVRGGSR